MAQRIINIGSSANKGDGDPIRTAFGKVNDNFTELYGKVAVLEDGTIAQVQDTKGSIFADDSTLLVDAVNGLIPASVVSGTLNNNTVGTHTGPVDGDLVGSVFADNSTLLVDGVNGTIPYSVLSGAPTLSSVATSGDYNDLINTPVTSVAFADLTSTPTTIAGYGITDAFDGDYNSLSNQPTIPSAYADTNVDAHLNTGTASSGEVLSWTGSDYDWVAQSGGGGADLSAVNQNYTPDTDNAYDLGIAAGNFLRSGYFKTSVVIGTDQYTSATLTYNASGHLQSSAGINTSALYSNSYMSIEPQYGGLIFWMDGDAGGGTLGYSANNGSNEMTWSGDMYSNGPTYQLDNDKANLQIGAEVTKTISGVTLGATTSLNFSDPYYFNPNSTVTITGVVGTTELNNQTYFINSSNELFTDAALTTPLNSSAFTAYVSGGTAVVAPRATMSLPVLHSPPSSPTNGMMAIADGTNWNVHGGTAPGLTIYYNGQWWPTTTFAI